MYKLRDWFRFNNFRTKDIYRNSKALDIIETKQLKRGHICYLCENPNPRAVYLVKDHQHYIYDAEWESLSANPGATRLLEEYPGYLDWEVLSANPGAISVLERYPERIDWINLSYNPAAIHLLEKNMDKICWPALSENPAAIPLLEKNIDRVCWPALSKNPNAGHILEKHPDKVLWGYILENPGAIRMIENADVREIIRNDRPGDSHVGLFWEMFNMNVNAVHLLETKYPDKIN